MIRLLFVAMAISPCMTAADTLESVQKALVAKYESYKSMTAKIDMKMNMGGQTGTSKGTVETMTDGDKEKVRSEMDMTMSFGGQSMEMHVLNIDNGKDAYTVSDMMGQKRVMQTDRSKVTGRAGGKMFFDELRKSYTLKLLPSQKIDGHDAYVIEATPKEMSPNGPARIVHYFDQARGILIKMEGFETGGESIMTMKLSDVKINPKIDPKRFEYTPEPGVDVMDMRQP